MKKKVTDVPNGSTNNDKKKSKKKSNQSNDTKAKRPRLSSSCSAKKDGKKRKKSLDNAVEGDSVKKHVTGQLIEFSSTRLIVILDRYERRGRGLNGRKQNLVISVTLK